MLIASRHFVQKCKVLLVLFAICSIGSMLMVEIANASQPNTNGVVATSADKIMPIKVGSPLPNGQILTMDNKSTTLKDAVQDKAAIIIFYRGSW